MEDSDRHHRSLVISTRACAFKLSSAAVFFVAAQKRCRLTGLRARGEVSRVFIVSSGGHWKLARGQTLLRLTPLLSKSTALDSAAVAGAVLAGHRARRASHTDSLSLMSEALEQIFSPLRACHTLWLSKGFQLAQSPKPVNAGRQRGAQSFAERRPAVYAGECNSPSELRLATAHRARIRRRC